MKRVIVIDNYDSFVYNIVQYIGEVEPECRIEIFRNDEITIDEIEKKEPKSYRHLSRSRKTGGCGYLR